MVRDDLQLGGCMLCILKHQPKKNKKRKKKKKRNSRITNSVFRDSALHPLPKAEKGQNKKIEEPFVGSPFHNCLPDSTSGVSRC